MVPKETDLACLLYKYMCQGRFQRQGMRRKINNHDGKEIKFRLTKVGNHQIEQMMATNLGGPDACGQEKEKARTGTHL
jgi:hypothetical protein